MTDVTPDFELRLRAYAEVVIRVGLNLQRGQRLLIAEPYELQGVERSAESIVEAVKAVADEGGYSTPDAIEVIWSDAARLREMVQEKQWGRLAKLVGTNANKMNDYVQSGNALLFLLGCHPGLMDGIAPKQVAEARRIGNEYFGPVAQQLTQGDTNWTAIPAPSIRWANVVFPDRSENERLTELWESVFRATRVPKYDWTSGDQRGRKNPGISALAAWEIHLQALRKYRDELNAQQFTSLNYTGEGTDLTVELPLEHLWCTANLRTKSGISFVANLPTEEVFTVPHKDSTRGAIRVTRPIIFGGSMIEGIELEFQRGRVVKASAQTGEALLQRLLDADEGASRLGEIALAGRDTSPRDGKNEIEFPTFAQDRCFQHVLLDENAGNHVALGESYSFCLKAPNPVVLNRSLIHVDLPVAAKANLRK